MSFFEFNEHLEKISNQALEMCKESFNHIEEIGRYNSEKVLSSFIKNRVSDIHFKGTTGYGYGDDGRDKLDKVYADILGAEDALVRHTFVNGTHAIATALFGVLRPNDVLLSITGTPYDTLQNVIFGDGIGSLKDFGVKYEQIDLLDGGVIDYDGIETKAKGCKVAYIQRSRGYSLRKSFNISEIERIIKAVRAVNKDAIVMVDNCYGELVEKFEPTSVGADLIIGSLIKNLGGGIAETGGYIAGKSDLVELCAYRSTTPGTGKEVGCTLNQTRGMFLGLFHASQAVENALKTSVYATGFFELLGYEAFPRYNEERTDIIAALKLGGKEALCAFCEGIQGGSPVDSFATPEPWDMPGYDSQVIMAAGAFTMGASIEISADAPLREPFAVWLQGGLTFNTGRIAVMSAAQKMLDRGLLKINNKI